MKCLVDISEHSSMRIGGQVAKFCLIREKEQIPIILNSDKDVIIIGAGSNTVFDDKFLDVMIAKMAIKGIKISHRRDGEYLVKFNGGEKWKDVINFCVARDLAGIENLAGIPGTAGAAPIQNIGAYGTEICQVLELAEVYDRKNKIFLEIKNKDCGFSYRDSIFKKYPDRWVVTAITLKLHKNTSKETVAQIKRTIELTRNKKIPNPKKIPNCGSFFKNPTVSKEEFSRLKKVLPDVPVYPLGSKFKVAAGYLIEKAGLKGSTLGRNKKIKICDYNALILTNIGGASFSNLCEAAEIVKSKVYKNFKIRLEPEVNIITKNV